MLSQLEQYFSHLRHYLKHKTHQTSRLSRKSIEFICLLFGALLVALVSWGFAKLVELGLEINTFLVNLNPIVAWILLPFGITSLAWFTQKFTPYVAGSGILKLSLLLLYRTASLKKHWYILLKPSGKFRSPFWQCVAAHPSGVKGLRYRWAQQ